MSKWIVKKFKTSPILEVWETYNGDLYFVTEHDPEDYDQILCYARLYNMPDFAEWGWNSVEYLKKAYGHNKFWKVPSENWSNINTYEKELFNEVKR